MNVGLEEDSPSGLFGDGCCSSRLGASLRWKDKQLRKQSCRPRGCQHTDFRMRSEGLIEL
eukprot:2187731-Amphidinium_carterae.1